jgi:hypothetical protein
MGIERNASIAPQPIAAHSNRQHDARLRYLALHLHELGPRALYEFLIGLGDRFGGGVLEHLEPYGRVDPATVRALDAWQLANGPAPAPSRAPPR